MEWTSPSQGVVRKPACDQLVLPPLRGWSPSRGMIQITQKVTLGLDY